MERKRSYLEIAYDILLTARCGVKTTHLVYGANLNFNIIKKYLQEMMDADLITLAHPLNREGSKMYYTTERGYEFMESFLKTINLYRKAIDCPKFQEVAQEVAQEII